LIMYNSSDNAIPVKGFCWIILRQPDIYRIT
jgi:hypothetical protein